MQEVPNEYLSSIPDEWEPTDSILQKKICKMIEDTYPILQNFPKTERYAMTADMKRIMDSMVELRMSRRAGLLAGSGGGFRVRLRCTTNAVSEYTYVTIDGTDYSFTNGVTTDLNVAAGAEATVHWEMYNTQWHIESIYYLGTEVASVDGKTTVAEYDFIIDRDLTISISGTSTPSMHIEEFY